jgi:hypothetical protein
VAVLRLRAAVTWLCNDYIISAELYERITQLQYLLQISQISSRTSEKAVTAKFAESLQSEVRGITLPRTRMNKGKEKGRGY